MKANKSLNRLTNEQVENLYNFLIKNNIVDKQVYTLASSLNNNPDAQTIYKDTKYIIVGSITPPNVDNGGFYYCKNPFLYIVLDKSNIAKHNDYSDCRVHKGWKQIKKNLKEDKIGFIDVFDIVIRPNNSSADEDILASSIDRKNILKVWSNNKDSIFICTSNLARKLFTECVENLGDYGKRKDSIRQMRLFRTSLANAIESMEEAIK